MCFSGPPARPLSLGDQGRHLPGSAANRARCRRLAQGRRLTGPLPGPGPARAGGSPGARR